MKVTVVIPVGGTKRDQKYLSTLLDNIEEQTIKCEVLLISEGNIGYARKVGVERAKGDIIAMLDSDVTLPSKDWMEKMLAPFEDPEVEIVHTLGTYHKDDPIVMRFALNTHPYKEGFSAGTGHTLMRKSTILKYGNFRGVNGCEDRLLIDQMKGKQVYMPYLKVYHYHATTIRQYLNKWWRVKVDCDKVAQDYPEARRLAYKDKDARKARSEYLNHNIKNFLRALVGKSDSSFLLFPIMAIGILFATKIAPHIWKRKPYKIEE